MPDSRVLIIEDEPMVQLLFEEAVNDSGLELAGFVESNKQALDRIEQDDFDMAVLDVNLTDGCSARVAQRLKDRDIPTMVVTGDSFRKLPEAFSGLTVLMKPFPLGLLSSMLADFSLEAAFRTS